MPSHSTPNSAALFARLPPYLLSHALEFTVGYGDSSVFTSLFRVSEVSRAFLEALAFVKVLHVDWRRDTREDREPSRRMAYDGVLLSHSYDTPVRRWCEVARSRLKNVTYMNDGGGIGPTFNAEQTRAIIDCAASFPHLTQLQLSDCEPVAACASIAAHVRAGRFMRLECLDMDETCTNLNGPCLWRHLLTSEEAMQSAKRAIRDLVSHVPVNLALYVHLGGESRGMYPWLMEEDDEYDTWRSELIGLINRGADLTAHPTLIMFLDELRFVPSRNYNAWTDAHLDTAFNTIELLLDRGADPRASDDSPWRGTYGPLSCLLWGLKGSVGYARSQPHLGDREPLFQKLMRTIDLFFRLGAATDLSDASFLLYRREHRTEIDFGAWILARPDCTQLLREDVLRHARLHRDNPQRDSAGERFPTAVDDLV